MSASAPNQNANDTTLHPRLASPHTAHAIGIGASLAILASVPLSVLARGGFPGIVLIPYGIVGAVIAWRQPGNPIGSILLLLTLAVVASADAAQYAVMAYQDGYHLPLARVAVFLAPGTWMWLIVLLPLPLALFPDGRLPRRWRRVLLAYLVLCAFIVASIGWQDLTGVIARQIQVGSSGQLASFGSSGTSAGDAIVILLYLGFGLAWVARLLLGYRRSTGDYRQQLKWLLSGGAIGIGGLMLAVTTGSDTSFWGILGGIGFGVSLLALPVALGVAILKYRLYDIDRLISRTLVYGALTLILGAAYVGLVLAGQALFASFAGGSNLAIAVSTLAVAALFLPLRSRVQRLVDQRFYRSHYDAQQTLEAFGVRLRDEVELDVLSADLLGAVADTMRPASASLWLNDSRQHVHVVTIP